MPDRSLGDVQRALAPEQAVVALNQFEDELAVWVIRARPDRRRDAADHPARRADAGGAPAGRDLARRRQTGGQPRPVQRDSSADRDPAAGCVTARRRARCDLRGRAFAALWDSARQRFLVEDVTLSLAPSVGAFVTGLAAAPANARVDEPMILGGPDRRDPPRTPSPPLYPAPTLVTGSVGHARSTVRRRRRRTRVVHLSVADRAETRRTRCCRASSLADERGRRHSGESAGAGNRRPVDVAYQPGRASTKSKRPARIEARAR